MKRTLLLLFTIPLFVSCGKDAIEVFDAKAKKFAESKHIITLEELTDLQHYAGQNQGEPGFEEFFTNEKLDNAKLVSYLEKGKKYKVEKPYNPRADVVNIYIENSLSMLGYINNNGSGFKNALAQIFSVSEKFKGYTSNYINSEIIPADLNTDNIVGINTAAFTRGNVKSSNLDGVFKTVLDQTKNNTISILVSDCIYSIEKGDATELLKRQALLTQRTFENKVNKANELATLVIKLDSDFAGTYYDKRDRAHEKVAIKRPYYIIIMGDDASVAYFKSKIDFSTLDGYANSYTINSKNYSDNLYHSVVTLKNSNSMFRPIDDLSDGKSIKGIEDISVDEGDFNITVALDLSHLPVDGAYITDKSNYTITTGDYVVKNIKAYNPKDIEARDATTIKQSGVAPTHLVTFKATSKHYESLTFSLTRKTPVWVKDTDIQDDTDVTTIGGKTFGFQHLIKGIEKAYTAQNGTTPYFEILITINN